jgi:tetratricopeptide (TPR) repeat protein
VVVALAASLAGLGAVATVQTRANGALEAKNGELTRANVRVESANADLNHANADLATARDREAARFKLAMDAIGVFHDRVAADFLLQQAEFAPLRGRLLKGAADFYKKLEVDLIGQDDRPSLRALGRAYLALGTLIKKIGLDQEAIARLRQSVEIRRRLAEGMGSGEELRAELAQSLICEWKCIGFRDGPPGSGRDLRGPRFHIADFRGLLARPLRSPDESGVPGPEAGS